MSVLVGPVQENAVQPTLSICRSLPWRAIRIERFAEDVAYGVSMCAIEPCYGSNPSCHQQRHSAVTNAMIAQEASASADNLRRKSLAFREHAIFSSGEWKG